LDGQIDAAKDSEVVVLLEDNLLRSDVKVRAAMAEGGLHGCEGVCERNGAMMAKVWFGTVARVQKSND